MILKIKKIFLFNFIWIFFFFSCNFQSENKNTSNLQTVSFMTWNTQTFFDGTNDGSEYSEFGPKYWNSEKYQTRLERLCKILTEINADIVVLQEIENEAVIQDISNALAGNSWNKNNIWPYGCFAKGKNEAFGCGIISKFPISEIKTHSLDIKDLIEEQPPMRPIVEANINVNGKSLIVFANHWKSKSGGAEETEKWRQWQESILCHCINDLKKAGKKYCIAAGDFNKDISEFSLFSTSQPDFQEKNKLIYKEKGIPIENITLQGKITNCENVHVYSPWINFNGDFTTERGSYFYKGCWSRIDNILAWGQINITDFQPLALEPWADENNVPIKYKVYTGEGYSDHLPLFCNINFCEEEINIP